MRKVRRHTFDLPEELSDRLREITRRPGSSVTQIMIDAVTVYLDRGAAHELETRFAVRLDRQNQSIDRLNRRMSFIAEALGTFIQHQLTLVAHQGPFEPETAALGRRRYQAFIELVGRRIAQAAGTSNTDHKSTSVSPEADASPADERD
jgi:predicted transcriptional regulator